MRRCELLVLLLHYLVGAVIAMLFHEVTDSVVDVGFSAVAMSSVTWS